MKQGSTSKRYSDAELAEFKELVLAKKERIESEINSLKSRINNNNSGDEFDTRHDGFDHAQELAAKEELIRDIGRQETLLRDLNLALIRIENKTYGVCVTSGELIPKARLQLVPHATKTVAVKNSRTNYKKQ